MKISFLSRAQNALENFLHSIKLSREERHLVNSFNFEMANRKMGGHKMRRFTPPKVTSVFADFSGFTASAVALVGQQINNITRDTINQLRDAISLSSFSAVKAPLFVENTLTATFSGNVDVAKPVYEQLRKDVLAFETKRDSIVESIDPEFIGPSADLFELYREAPQNYKLSVLFNSDGQAAYMHSAEKVKSLSTEFKAQVDLNPELSKVPTMNIMTFSTSVTPETSTDQITTGQASSLPAPQFVLRPPYVHP